MLFNFIPNHARKTASAYESCSSAVAFELHLLNSVAIITPYTMIIHICSSYSFLDTSIHYLVVSLSFLYGFTDSVD